MQRVGLRSGVGHRDLHQDVVGIGLGVVHLDDPVPVVVERPRVQQLVLGLELVARPVLIDQVLVGKRALRVVVTPSVPRVARDRVQIPPVLLDVLAVIALRAGQPEGPLLQDRIAPVPQCETEAQPLLDVAEPGQPVLTPPIGVGPGIVVRYVVPRVTAGAVVLAYRPPLPLTDVWPPVVPVTSLAQPVLKLAEPRDPFTFRPHRSPAFRLAKSCGEPRNSPKPAWT